MADVITQTSELKIVTYFVDGDTRTLTIADPKTTLTSTDILNLQTQIRTGNLLIGDKSGATFGRINTADIVTTTRTKFDIS